MADLLVAGAALVVLSPVLIVIAVAVRMKLGTPVVFQQQRPGLGGRPFCLLKFRTMSDARSQSGELLSDGERLSHFGRWLRASSLDELPELWNVFLGDMSLVGPRPLLMAYLPRYSKEQARRHLVRPGLTGWAQVNGRNALTWPEKFRLDVWYVENATIALDLMIIGRTIMAVFAGNGVAAPGHPTMPPFEGETKT